MMTNFEEAIFNFIMHFFLVVMLFIGFCAVMFILALTLIVVWNFISEGYKYFKKWRDNRDDTKV